jgi:drug/metabolite transporter (DMT)-like permease
MVNNSTSRLAHLALLAVSTIYGINYIVARDVMVGGWIRPNAFIFLRVMVALILFFTLHRQHAQFSRNDHWRLVACGLTGVAINQLFFFNGLKLSGPIQASLIMVVTPVLVYLLSLIFLGNVFRWYKGVGILFGIFGTGLIIYQKEGIEQFENAYLGNILVFLNALSYAFYLVLVKPLMTKYPPVQVLKWVFFYGFIFILPFSIKPFIQTSFANFSMSTVCSIIYVVVATTYIAYRLNGFALSRVNPTVVSIYLYLQPVVAMLASIALGIESMNVKKSMAAALILVSILFVSIEKPIKNSL